MPTSNPHPLARRRRVHRGKPAGDELARSACWARGSPWTSRTRRSGPRSRTASAKSSKPLLVGVRGEPVQHHDLGAPRPHHAEDADLGPALDEPAAERVLGLETHDHHRVARVARWCVRRWWSTRPASHMPLAEMMIDGRLLDVDRLGLLDVGDVLQPVELERRVVAAQELRAPLRRSTRGAVGRRRSASRSAASRRRRAAAGCGLGRLSSLSS